MKQEQLAVNLLSEQLNNSHYDVWGKREVSRVQGQSLISITTKKLKLKQIKKKHSRRELANLNSKSITLPLPYGGLLSNRISVVAKIHDPNEPRICGFHRKIVGDRDYHEKKFTSTGTRTHDPEVRSPTRYH